MARARTGQAAGRMGHPNMSAAPEEPSVQCSQRVTKRSDRRHRLPPDAIGDTVILLGLSTSPRDQTVSTETGGLLHVTDWSHTPLGTMDEWPQSLKLAVGICLS